MYKPDAILVSHFHPHHSSKRDIEQLCNNSFAAKKAITLLYPEPIEPIFKKLEENVDKKVIRSGVKPGDTFEIGPFTIQAYEHTVPLHTAWYVKSKTGSVFHIADGRINKNDDSRSLDPCFLKIKNLSPSLLFISSGGHSKAEVRDEKRVIREGLICSGVEAAKIAECLAPKGALIIGLYNNSIWKNWVEYIRPAPQTEEEFTWALSYLAPKTKHISFYPGTSIGINELKLFDKCDINLFD